MGRVSIAHHCTHHPRYTCSSLSIFFVFYFSVHLSTWNLCCDNFCAPNMVQPRKRMSMRTLRISASCKVSSQPCTLRVWMQGASIPTLTGTLRVHVTPGQPCLPRLRSLCGVSLTYGLCFFLTCQRWRINSWKNWSLSTASIDAAIGLPTRGLC